MYRYIIRRKKDGKYLKRTKGYSVRSDWVSSADDATLITQGSAATQIAQRFCIYLGNKTPRFMMKHQHVYDYPVEIIKVGVLLFPIDKQPFIEALTK